MSEKAKEIKVKLQYIPEKDDDIEVEISPTATVSELKIAFKNKLKKEKGDEFDKFISENPVGFLRLYSNNLRDESKTLQESGIKDGSVIQNENRVFINLFMGKESNTCEIKVTCNENTTLEKFLEKARENPNLKTVTFITVLFASNRIKREYLDKKLFNLRGNNNGVVGYGSRLYFQAVFPVKSSGFDDAVFNLQELNSTEEQLKEAWNKKLEKNEEELKEDTMNKVNDPNNQSQTSKTQNKKGEHLQNNWPLSRIIIGIIDLVLLALAVAACLLHAHIAIPIVISVFFVIFTFLFFGGNNLVPKDWRGSIDLGTAFLVKNENRDIDKHKENINQKNENEKTIDL